MAKQRLDYSLLASQETRYAQNHFRHQTLGYVRMQQGSCCVDERFRLPDPNKRWKQYDC